MNTTEWINKKLGVDIAEPQYESVRNFLYIWNIFENKILDNHTGENSIASLSLSNISLIDSQINYFYNFSRDRYVSNVKIKDNFYKLRIRSSQLKNDIESILIRPESELQEKLKACLVIVYRYRCNLFHGNKSLYKLWNQVELFEYSNVLLISIIDTFNKE